MRGKRVVLGAVALLTLVVVAARPGPAGAEEVCTNRVFDDAGRLGAMRQAVDQTTATMAQATKADIYVRVLARVPGADLDGWQAEMERRCPNWQNGAGGRASALVVMAVAVDDRKTGIYYGEQWRAALDPQWRAIQDTAMNPRFKEGDIGGGIVSGLAEVVTALATRPVVSAPSAEPVYRDEPSFDDGLRGPVPGPSVDFDDGFDPFPSLFVLFALMAGVIAFARFVMGSGGSSDADVATAGLHRRYGWRSRRSAVDDSGDDDDDDSSSGLLGGLFSGGGSGTFGGGGSTSWGGGSSDHGGSSTPSSSPGPSSGGGGGGGSTSW